MVCVPHNLCTYTGRVTTHLHFLFAVTNVAQFRPVFSVVLPLDLKWDLMLTLPLISTSR